LPPEKNSFGARCSQHFPWRPVLPGSAKVTLGHVDYLACLFYRGGGHMPRLFRTEPLPKRLGRPSRPFSDRVERASFAVVACMLYELIPNMPEIRLRPLVQRFSEYVTQNRALAQSFSF